MMRRKARVRMRKAMVRMRKLPKEGMRGKGGG